jgi:hypothetical protein
VSLEAYPFPWDVSIKAEDIKAEDIKAEALKQKL